MTEASEMVKIRFYDEDVGYENLWAELTDQVEGLYAIKSIPFFIYDISVDDLVRAVPDADGVLAFVSMVKHSPHKTIRVRPRLFTLDEEEGKALVRKLEEFGCEIEQLPPRLIAVDIADEHTTNPLTEFLTADSIPLEWADRR